MCLDLKELEKQGCIRSGGAEGREKERERNINVWLPLPCPLLGTWLAIQASALTGNRTTDPLVFRPVLNLLSYTIQGQDGRFFL